MYDSPFKDEFDRRRAEMDAEFKAHQAEALERVKEQRAHELKLAELAIERERLALERERLAASRPDGAGLLPDHEILRMREALVVPFDERRVQPASYDLTLHPQILVPIHLRKGRVVDLRIDKPRDLVEAVDLGEGYDLMPGDTVIASTVEAVRCPANIASRVEGKSTMARLFVAVHVTAGWVDPGWPGPIAHEAQGQVTLEIVNHGPWVVTLWPGMPIAQANFTRMASECRTPYGSTKLGSHYHGQVGPSAAVGERGKP